MKRTIEVEVTLPPGGRIIEETPGHFSGGIAFPNLRSSDLSFEVFSEGEEHGHHHPADDARSVEGAFQLTINGTSAGYRELAGFLLAIAELDTSADPSFHEHVEGIISTDGRTRFDFIIRKTP